MKIALCLVAGVAAVAFAYAMVPDAVRYMKMKAM